MTSNSPDAGHTMAQPSGSAFITQDEFVSAALSGDSAPFDSLLRLRQSQAPTYLFGAGVYAYVAKRYLELLGIRLSAAIVDEPREGMTTFFGLPVLSTKAVASELPNANVLLGVTDYLDVSKRLASMGAKCVWPVDVPDYLNMPDAFIDADYISAHVGELYSTYQLWADDLSRETYVASLRAKLFRNPTYLLPVTRPDHIYFSRSEFPITEHEVLLDVGGYTGDTIRDLRKVTGDNFQHIVSLEPDPENYRALNKEAEVAPKGSVTIMPFGAWDSRAELKMAQQAGDIDNKISDAGSVTIHVDQIDSLLASFSERLTTIKVDINGAEWRALKGASSRIRSDRPRIVTRLHTKEDYTRIPMLLKQVAPDVRLYLRQRSYMSVMVFLYAVF
jgi:FkbM family methyltransferase